MKFLLKNVLFLTFLCVGCSPTYNKNYITSANILADINSLKKTISSNSITELSRLKKNKIFIMNGVIINPMKQTFGESLNGGFYKDYEIKSQKNKYSDWNSLIEQSSINTKISEKKLNSLISKMKKDGITDIFFDSRFDVYSFQWGSSVMNGFNGIILGSKDNSESAQKKYKYDIFEQISNGTYYFELR